MQDADEPVEIVGGKISWAYLEDFTIVQVSLIENIRVIIRADDNLNWLNRVCLTFLTTAFSLCTILLLILLKTSQSVPVSAHHVHIDLELDHI